MKKQDEKSSVEELNQVYNECLEYLKSLTNNDDDNKDAFEESSDDESDSSDDYDEGNYEAIKLNNIRNNGSIDKTLLKNSKRDTKTMNGSRNTELEKIKINELKTSEETLNDILDKDNQRFGEELGPKLCKKTTSEDEDKDHFESKGENNITFKNEAEDRKKDIQFEIGDEKIEFKVENELKPTEDSSNAFTEPRSERLRKLSQQLPKIVITTSSGSVNKHDTSVSKHTENFYKIDTSKMGYMGTKKTPPPVKKSNLRTPPPLRNKTAYGVFPKRLVSKSGIENVALISNVPFEKIRLLNDTFHTLINLRWRWIVSGTVVVHFGIWLVFAVWWYVAALAHYDLEPDPPRRACVTGGKDFVTIFLASVEAQTTIGFGDRAIDEECPEAIFLFIMQLILGTGLSGVLTCVVYAKLTRPEKLSRDGVGFSKKAVISLRDGSLCLMLRAWDLNYDHIINSEFSAHFITTHRTKEGETLRYYARSLPLQQRQFLLWPVTLVHVIDEYSPLYRCSPELLANGCYEITVSLKGASASMGTFTQSQTSYMPRELVWGHRFPPVVKYDKRKQKYVIDHKKLDVIEPVDTPYCSASQLYSYPEPLEPGTPSMFSERISSFVLERSSSFRRINTAK